MPEGTQKKVLVVCPNPSIDILAQIAEFTIGVPNRIQTEERYPGGKGLHVAMALAELGIDVTVLGFWGGATGQWIKKETYKYYPKIQFIGPEIEELSRSCYTFKSNDTLNDTELLGTGPVITREQFENFLQIFIESFLSYSMIAFSGSWPQGVPEDAYKKLISLAKNTSIKTFIDCTGVQLKNVLHEKPFCIHLNKKEIKDFFHTDQLEEAIENILQHTHYAAITDGANGLYFHQGNTVTHALTSINKVLSTVGSGDCLLAGIIYGFIYDFSFEKIAMTGAACGAANCMRKELGMLYKNDVFELFKNNT